MYYKIPQILDGRMVNNEEITMKLPQMITYIKTIIVVFWHYMFMLQMMLSY